VLPPILAGGKSGGLGEEFSESPRVEGFVVYGGRRVGNGFCSRHFQEKAKKEKKEGRIKGLVEDDGVTRRNPEKQKLRRKSEKT